MKRNVDLTENGDFIGRDILSGGIRNHTSVIGNLFRIYNRVLYPWDPRGIRLIADPVENIEDKWGIIQGNGSHRKGVKFSNEFGKKNLCDCCGREIKPWYDYCLCNKCVKRFDEEREQDKCLSDLNISINNRIREELNRIWEEIIH